MKRFTIAIAALCALASSLFFVHRTAYAQVALSPVAHMQFLDSSARPLAGGCVFTYSAGTTTPLATYIDSSGSISNPNPVILDSGGFANIWLSATAYKFVVYSNGGVNCSTGTYQWAVDNITTSTSSGSGVASSLVSGSPNPATGGIIRMATGDRICWRNAANSADLCVSKDSQDRLIWAGKSFFQTEGAAPGGLAGQDGLYADSTAHRLGMVNNATAADIIVGQATTDTFTNKTFDTAATGNALKVAGNTIDSTVGSGTAVVLAAGFTGTGDVVLQTGPTITSAALVTPTIGGTTITNVPQLAWNAIVYCVCNFGNASPDPTPLSLMDTNQGGILIQHFRLQASPPGFTTCSTYPQYEIYDETAAAAVTGSSITMVSTTTTYDVNVAQNVPASHVLDIRLLNAASGTCNAGGAATLGSVEATVGYIMQ